MKTVSHRELWKQISAAAAKVYEPREADAICRMICEELLGSSMTDMIVNPDGFITDSSAVKDVIARIESATPAQYIVGHTIFCDLKLTVTPDVLIPRPETEELVNWVIRSHNHDSELRVLDIGTGSGAIAISLAKMMNNAAIAAVDLSQGALEVAKQNGLQNGVAIDFSICDIINQTPIGSYDIIVSNPPYVTLDEKMLMMPNVIEHEPHLALFVPDHDPLLFYRAIAEKGLSMLKKGGALYFEINEGYAHQTTGLLESFGYRNIEVCNDIFDKPRMIRAWLS